MIQNIKKLLFQPYPIDDNTIRKFVTILWIGVFVVVFIMIFGLNEEITQNKFPITLGFGMIIIIVLSINKIIIPCIFPKLFLQNSWIVLKEILLILLNISSIGFAMLVYANIGGYYDINIKTIFNSIFTSAMIGVFPVVFMILIKQNLLLKINMNGADDLNKYLSMDKSRPLNKKIQEGQQTIIYSENRKDSVRLRLENIHLVKSVDNYVEIYWADEGKIQRTLLRSSLKQISAKFDNQPDLIRCHRAYIINIDKIVKVKGNSQGYKLLIMDYENLIPISRSYLKLFRNYIADTRNL